VSRAFQLASTGMTASEVARETGLPRRTVGGWLTGHPPARLSARKFDPSAHVDNCKAAYAYVLGIYLGDGHLNHMRRGVYRLFVTLDATYPGIVEETRNAVSALMPENRVTPVARPRYGVVNVCCYSKLWPALLPQHGPGPKHAREIRLTQWQLRITRAEPRVFIRALIHSDGCRFVARQPSRGRVYSYPRYSFSNRSEDILRIFCDHLDLIGVAWTRASAQNVQIARQEEVARLDEFVGPKR
jgi:hypothetical protein